MWVLLCTLHTTAAKTWCTALTDAAASRQQHVSDNNTEASFVGYLSSYVLEPICFCRTGARPNLLQFSAHCVIQQALLAQHRIDAVHACRWGHSVKQAPWLCAGQGDTAKSPATYALTTALNRLTTACSCPRPKRPCRITVKDYDTPKPPTAYPPVAPTGVCSPLRVLLAPSRALLVVLVKLVDGRLNPHQHVQEAQQVLSVAWEWWGRGDARWAPSACAELHHWWLTVFMLAGACI